MDTDESWISDTGASPEPPMSAQTSMPAEAGDSEATESSEDGNPADAAEMAPEAETAVEDLAVVPLELYVVRHADAGDPMAWTGDDADRPLSKKGRRQARGLGRLLRNVKLGPKVVITSPKVRSAQTARRIAKATGADLMSDERLGGAFGEDQLRDLVGELDRGVARVMLVGHDPDFSQLASWLVGAHVGLPKGSLVRIDLGDRKISAGAGSLRWLLPPDAVAG